MFFVEASISVPLKSDAAESWNWYWAAPATEVQWNAGSGTPLLVVSGVGAASDAALGAAATSDRTPNRAATMTMR